MKKYELNGRRKRRYKKKRALRSDLDAVASGSSPVAGFCESDNEPPSSVKGANF